MDAAPTTVFWFRRDLRLSDNRGLIEAIKAGNSPLMPVFIFDENILRSLERDDARVTFLHETLDSLEQELRTLGHRLFVFVGKPKDVFADLMARIQISAVHANEDYEPYAIRRDAEIGALLKKQGIELYLWKDHVISAPTEVVKDDGTPYRVYTPFSRRWLETLKVETLTAFRSREAVKKTKPFKFKHENPSLKDLGFTRSALKAPKLILTPKLVKDYLDERDFMALNATSKAGTHLRFGTISIREAVKAALEYSETWLKELAWREFFQMILFHYPRTVDEPFDARFNEFPWRTSASDLKRWQEGQTGYPIVDAGMRELNETGFMHNRARMIVGSFLTKHLLLDWRLGERYFAGKLFDFELASNVGNWQWVAGCGVDAAPYFRIFNPALQTKRFDKGHEYIRRWVPEFESQKYPAPMVEHEFARRRALMAYEKIKRGKK